MQQKYRTRNQKQKQRKANVREVHCFDAAVVSAAPRRAACTTSILGRFNPGA
jgi:hypothetical protein